MIFDVIRDRDDRLNRWSLFFVDDFIEEMP